MTIFLFLSFLSFLLPYLFFQVGLPEHHISMEGTYPVILAGHLFVGVPWVWASWHSDIASHKGVSGVAELTPEFPFLML